eukprot:TRINITY_DN47599_c0_g1_i1.p1 TRINITY_DN47599_c0_g1~~TRINITY_DN47599_c0_g1_i1.p1  ORF type:complete len:507 (-),score=71.47 TRINITY_DN47599_c0_g1_i1:111-1631(-)
MSGLVGIGRAFRPCDVHVIVADDEDICREAAIIAVKKFGFRADHVHGAESSEEGLDKLLSVHSEVTHGELPTILILPPRFCVRFRGRDLPNEVFVISSTSNRMAPSEVSHMCHCSIPKTFDQSALADIFDACLQWWTGDANITADALEPMQMATTQYHDPSPSLKPGPRALDPRKPEVNGDDAGSSTARTAGNCMESLDSLLPPRPPFEDIITISLCGRGSFGRVYLARWDASPVALKVVEGTMGGNVKDALFEGSLSVSLAHPNVVQTFKHSIREVGHGMMTSCEVWIVQEWCSEGTLGDKIRSEEIMREGGYIEVAEVSCEITSAAAYLHSRGIIHGDLTANNVLCVKRSSPKGYIAKVSDFGLARILDSGMSAIHTRTIGTVSSMPPELFQLDGSSLTKKVDVYGFGIILWQMCCSKIPFEGLQPMQVAVVVASGGTLELPDCVPSSITDVYKRCTARDPTLRPDFHDLTSEVIRLLAEGLPGPPGGGRCDGSIYNGLLRKCA